MSRTSHLRRARSALVSLIPGTAARRKAIADLTERTNQLAACRAELAARAADLAACRAALAAREDERDASERGLAEARAEISTLRDGNTALRSENATLADQLQESQSRGDAATRALHALQDADAGRIRQARDSSLRQPVLDFLALLAPHQAGDFALTRVGRERDGGYVMLDDFTGIAGALSCGIADETSWDMAIAGRGIPVLQVDDSIDAPLDSHPLWTFHRRRVSAAAPEPSAITLRELVALCPGDGDSLVAKIDIEGSEWEALPPAMDSLARCRQLVIEFHDFDRLADPWWRATATAVIKAVVATHCPVHVHGNNFEPLVVLGGVPVPKVCEVTFALRTRYRLSPAQGLVPSALDFPNNRESADLHFALRYPGG
jgi:hypothetical protein